MKEGQKQRKVWFWMLTFGEGSRTERTCPSQSFLLESTIGVDVKLPQVPVVEDNLCKEAETHRAQATATHV